MTGKQARKYVEQQWVKDLVERTSRKPVAYRVEYTTEDGKRVLDPTVFTTKAAAEFRIGCLMVKEGARVIRQKPCPCGNSAHSVLERGR